MTKKKIFIDRRKRDRRTDPDPCTKMPLDLYHRKRRKSMERRKPGRTLVDDYYAFTTESVPDPETADSASDATADTDESPSRQ